MVIGIISQLIYSILIVWLNIILLLQRLLPPRYILNTFGLHDIGFGVQTLWTVPKSVYEIDILTLCAVILNTYVNLLNKRFWIWISNLLTERLLCGNKLTEHEFDHQE